MGPSSNSWNGQWVWPRDSKKGHVKLGFFKRLADVVSGTGPDMFIQKKGSKAPIPVDRWSNWDSYHTPEAANVESSYGTQILGRSRAQRRYDPHTRRYVEWDELIEEHHDPSSSSFQGRAEYPTFTRADAERYGSSSMPLMQDWTRGVPNRFDSKYDWYWRDAHRAGENMGRGVHPRSPHVNPYFLMSRAWEDGAIRRYKRSGCGSELLQQRRRGMMHHWMGE